MPPFDNSPDVASRRNPDKSLPADVKRLVDESVEVGLDLLRGYQHIARDAAAGKLIRGHTFTDEESLLDKRLNGIEARLATALAHGNVTQEALKAEATAYGDQAARAEPDLIHAFKTDALDRAFASEYVTCDRSTKNTQLAPVAHTEAGLVSAILSANRGFALGDLHVQNECCTFLARNMATFKARGVDTIYTESPMVQHVKDFTPAELRQLARDGHYKHVRLLTAKELAAAYGAKAADNVSAEDAKMLAAAKENGIRVVYIDKDSGAAREAETMEHRTASTNFIWTDNISADRALLAKQGEPAGKFIAFGGLCHFISDKYSHNGMVAKALDIPVIAYERADKHGPAFRQETNPNGPDFYLPGGMDYDDMRSAVADESVNVIGRLQQSTQGQIDAREIKPPASIPPGGGLMGADKSRV
jgi:hypothetical protein